jgi:CheY-like chemotaxis protein
VNKRLLICENAEALPATLQDYLRKTTARVLFVGEPRTFPLPAGVCCEVTAAADGEEGVMKAHQGRPDLIVLDAALLESTAFNVCGAIHANHATRSIPILVMHAISH